MWQRYSSLILILSSALSVLIFPLYTYASSNIYKPTKVVYDVSSSDPEALGNILDRISMLQNVYSNDAFDASIIVVVHEGAIPLFKLGAVQNLMSRARSLVMGDIIEFKICAASARMQHISVDQLHDFVSMVPMADAEIIRLQHDGYAYLR